MENTTTQPPVLVQETNTAPVSTMSQNTPQPRNKSKMIIVLIILFSLLFLIGAIALGMKFFNDSKKETILVPPSTPTPTTITKSNIPGFKSVSTTFADFQIPENWHLWKCNEQYYVLADWGAQESESDGCPFDGSQAMFINLSEISYQSVNNAIPATKDYGTQTATISSVKKITVDGKEAVQWKKEVTTNPGQDEGLGLGSYTEVFILPNINLTTSEKNSSIMDQILSTLKFTTTTAPDATSDWNTSSNNYFSIKYPNTLTDRFKKCGNDIYSLANSMLVNSTNTIDCSQTLNLDPSFQVIVSGPSDTTNWDLPENCGNIKTQNITVDNTPAVLKTYIAKMLLSDSCQFRDTTRTIMNHNGNQYVINYDPQKMNADTFKQIVSTFKFTN